MKKKLHLSLSEPEIRELLSLVSTMRSSSLLDQIRLQLEPDPNNPDPYIREKVYFALSDMSGLPTERIKDSDNLERNLGLSRYQIRALRDNFQQIVKDLGSDATIYIYECDALKRVTDCLEIIKSKL